MGPPSIKRLGERIPVSDGSGIICGDDGSLQALKNRGLM